MGLSSVALRRLEEGNFGVNKLTRYVGLPSVAASRLEGALVWVKGCHDIS
jgi:hypothetical protein